jgi:hypothetical protein
MNIEDFPISNRTKNTLKKAGYSTELDFKEIFLEDLESIDGFGNKGIVEIRDYLYSKFGIVVKHKPKEKKINNFKETQCIVNKFLNHCDNIFWPREIKMAKTLIDLHGYQTLLRVKPLTKVNTLSFYLTANGKKYITQFLPAIQIQEGGVSRNKPIEEEKEEVVIINSPEHKPKSIRDFFKI